MPHVTFIHGIANKPPQELIGLHHAGGFGLQRLDGQPGTYDANEGIQMQRIIEAVRAAGIAPPPAPQVQVGP